MTRTKKIIWIIADDRLGTTRQLEGVAQAIGGTIIHKHITFDWRVRFPNILRRVLGLGVSCKDWETMNGKDAPDVILSGGRRTAPIAAKLKCWYPKAVAMHFLNPNFPAKFFDFVVVPRHDQSIPKGDNVVFFDTAPHQITYKRLQSERKKWLPHFKKYRSPRVTVLIGGATKKTVFTPDMAREFGRMINGLVKRLGGSLLITNSRRTGEVQTAMIKKQLNVPHSFYEYGVSTGDNPMFGMTASADVMVVTGESVSMVSEALTTGKPVFVYDHADLLAPKHKRFIERLKQQGAVQSLTGRSALFKPAVISNSADQLVAIILDKLAEIKEG